MLLWMVKQPLLQIHGKIRNIKIYIISIINTLILCRILQKMLLKIWSIELRTIIVQLVQIGLTSFWINILDILLLQTFNKTKLEKFQKLDISCCAKVKRSTPGTIRNILLSRRIFNFYVQYFFI